MARRAKGCNGSGSITRESSEVLLFPVTPRRLTLHCCVLKWANVSPNGEHSWGSMKGSTHRSFLGVWSQWELWKPCLQNEKIDLGVSYLYIRVHMRTSKMSSLQKTSCLRGQFLTLLKLFQSLHLSAVIAPSRAQSLRLLLNQYSYWIHQEHCLYQIKC